MTYRGRDTTTEAGTSAKYVCICPPSMGKCFRFLFGFFFNQNFAHLNCNNCISIEDEAQRRLLSTLNSALGYILVYQVHWLLRQKKRNLFVRLQLTSVSMPIRDTLFTQSLAHTHTQNTYRLTHTYTYGIS